MIAERDRFYKKYNDLNDEKERKRHDEMMTLRSEKDELINQVRNLMEIIRWQIKPETAKSPFVATKDQNEIKEWEEFVKDLKEKIKEKIKKE